MMTLSPALPVLLLCFTSTILSTTRAFPSHFTDTGMGCMTELDETEVIMNNQVVPFKDSTDKSMYIDLTSNNDKIEVGSTVTLVFRNPKSRPDVMYVMEATSGGTFADGKCDNAKRVGGKSTAVSFAHSLVIHSLPVYVWGGWATGHEAVQLTDRLVLGVDPTEMHVALGEAMIKLKQQQQQNQQDEEETKRVAKEKEPPAPVKNDAAASHDTGSDTEEADMHERADVADELADDDKANLGDLSHQLQQGLNSKVANPADVIKAKMEQLKRDTADRMGAMKQGLGSHHKKWEEMKRLTHQLQHSKDKMQLLKDREPGAMLDHEDKKLQYLEKMKEHMDPERYQQMKDRMEQQFDRRDAHRKARHKVRPLHELKELGEQMEAGLEQEAKQKLPQDVRQRLEAFHLHDKRWADRLHKHDKDEAPSERTDDDTDPAQEGGGLAALLDKYSGHDHDLDMHQFLYACLFFVVTNVLVIQLCLCVGQRDKGRTQ